MLQPFLLSADKLRAKCLATGEVMVCRLDKLRLIDRPRDAWRELQPQEGSTSEQNNADVNLSDTALRRGPELDGLGWHVRCHSMEVDHQVMELYHHRGDGTARGDCRVRLTYSTHSMDGYPWTVDPFDTQPTKHMDRIAAERAFLKHARRLSPYG
jgi:hypothetical protein